MVKKLILEKLYILLTIITIGGYSTMSMLTIERDSLYTAEDPILLKFVVGMLFMTTIGYIVFNTRYIKFDSIGKILLFLSLYLANSKLLSLPPTVGVLSYLYQPMHMLFIVILYTLGQIIGSKAKELRDFFTTGMFIALLITAYMYYQNWSFANQFGQAHLGTAYYAMFLLMPILLSPNKWIRWISIAITAMVIISSLKRGGVVALAFALVVYLFVKDVLLERKMSKLLLFITLIIIMLAIFLYIDYSMGNIITRRLMTIGEDGGSGRDRIWATTWQMICQSSFSEMLFGHGYSAVVIDSPAGQSAHNDFLEILYDWGISFFIPYIILHFIIIARILNAIRQKEESAPVMAFTYTIFFVLSCISIVILYPLIALTTMVLGVCTPTIKTQQE